MPILLKFPSDHNLEQFDSEISKIDVDALATQRIIAKLKKEQKDLKEQVITSVKQNNPLVTELHDLISQYATRSNVFFKAAVFADHTFYAA